MSPLEPRPHRSRRSLTVRHGRQKTSHIVAGVTKLVAVALAVVLVSGASIAAIAAWNVTTSFKTVALAGDSNVSVPNISAIEGGVNMLLVGSDSRVGQGDLYGKTDGVLNDVTMLLHISQDHSSASVVSFPRDMVVPIPSCPDGQGGSYSAMSARPINEALSYGGLACVQLTVEALTGLKIPFGAEVQFNGVVEMSNALGGVPVCVATPISDPYTQTYLDAGTHTLAGEDALQFLRTRHGVGDGSDLGRISSQQVFLSALVRTIKSNDTLTDVTKLYGLAKAAGENMSLSQSLASVDTMVSIALALKDIPLDKIGFYAYPGTTGGSGVYSGKVQPLTRDAEVLFSAIRADKPVTGVLGNTGIGSEVDPLLATPTPTTAPDAAAPATAAPSATPAPGAAKILPESIKGQAASELTCSKGFGD
jgi:LCP family protein required for cell wall assembly